MQNQTLQTKEFNNKRHLAAIHRYVMSNDQEISKKRVFRSKKRRYFVYNCICPPLTNKSKDFYYLRFIGEFAILREFDLHLPVVGRDPFALLPVAVIVVVRTL